jgi:5-methylcytosine-specific restriction endonuclease McrA
MVKRRKEFCPVGHLRTFDVQRNRWKCQECETVSIKKGRRKWRMENPEKSKASRNRWKHAHPEKTLEYDRRRRLVSPEKIRENSRKWRKKNKYYIKAAIAKRRTMKTKAGGSFTSAEWNALCKKYKNKCLRCKKRRKLTADHVMPVSKGGTSNISNIQPLCGPCNSKKGTSCTDYRESPAIEQGKE